MSDPKRAFRVGFLQKCAEAGLTLEETCELASHIKQAVAGEHILGKGLEALGNAFKAAPGLATAAGLAAPALGFMGGTMYSSLTDIDEDELNEIKKREIIDLYRQQTRKLLEKKRGVPQATG
jgi:hypothetical protein